MPHSMLILPTLTLDYSGIQKFSNLSDIKIVKSFLQSLVGMRSVAYEPTGLLYWPY
jgi:hypothetical protein